MSQEAAGKQHENRILREGEKPNSAPRKNSQEDNLNPEKERNNPANNPSGDPQRRQEGSGTSHHGRDKQENSQRYHQ
jgi:hypothetical protein